MVNGNVTFYSDSDVEEICSKVYDFVERVDVPIAWSIGISFQLLGAISRMGLLCVYILLDDFLAGLKCFPVDRIKSGRPDIGIKGSHISTIYQCEQLYELLVFRLSLYTKVYLAAALVHIQFREKYGKKILRIQSYKGEVYGLFGICHYGSHFAAKARPVAIKFQDQILKCYKLELLSTYAQNLSRSTRILHVKLQFCGSMHSRERVHVPVCAPYNALHTYKYCVNIIPGTAKKGKATKIELNRFSHIAEVKSMVKELMKEGTDPDLVAVIVGNVKIMAAGMTQLKHKQKLYVALKGAFMCCNRIVGKFCASNMLLTDHNVLSTDKAAKVWSTTEDLTKFLNVQVRYHLQEQATTVMDTYPEEYDLQDQSSDCSKQGQRQGVNSNNTVAIVLGWYRKVQYAYMIVWYISLVELFSALIGVTANTHQYGHLLAFKGGTCNFNWAEIIQFPAEPALGVADLTHYVSRHIRMKSLPSRTINTTLEVVEMHFMSVERGQFLHARLMFHGKICERSVGASTCFDLGIVQSY